MMLQRPESLDPRPFHVKLLTIAGQTHFVSVLPPYHDKALDDDTVWKQHKPSLHHPQDEHGGILDYVITQNDKGN